MHAFLQDVRYGLRMLARSPGFAGVVAVTLGLGIGANTVIFSFANVLVLKPLPISDADRLGWIWSTNPLTHDDRSKTSLPDYGAFRDDARRFESMSGSRSETYTLTGRGDAERVFGYSVIGDLHHTWGLRAVAGRLLTSADERPGSPKVVVLSHRYWSRRFGASTGLVGDRLILNDESYEVVGVLAPDIEIGNLSEIQVWTPIQSDPLLAPRDQRTLRVTGRLRPGVTVAQAHAEVEAIAARLAAEYPETNRGWGARVVGTKEAIVSADAWLILTLLLIVVGLLLLIVCANITNLLLSRVIVRQQEIAVRMALGAGQARLLRQLVTENLLLGALGGLLGLAIGWLGLRAIRLAAYEPFFELLTVDRTVMLFAVLLSMVAPLLFSTIPALQATRRSVSDTLKEAGARTAGGPRARRSRNLLIGAQVALAVSLLITAGLIVQTMLAFTRIDLGFDPSGVLTMQLELPARRYPSDTAVTIAHDRILSELARLPGVASVGTVSSLPVLEQDPTVKFGIEGQTASVPDERPWAHLGVVSRDYFQTAEIPLLRGQAFSDRHLADGPMVAIVSREAARRYWRDAGLAIGARVVITESEPARTTRATVIGIVGNTANPDLESAPNPQIYVFARQRPGGTFSVMVRGSDPAALASHVREAVRSVDADLAVYKLRTLQEAFKDDRSTSLILASLFGAFAVLALLLATSGLYAVISYSVAQRTPEIAVRMALGASPGDIRRLVFGEGFRLTLTGLAFGLLGAFLLARAMARILYGVTPTDPLTYASALAALLSAAVLASLTPAFRASSVDPIRGLKQE